MASLNPPPGTAYRYYHAGSPLFTRDNIQDLEDQINRNDPTFKYQTIDNGVIEAINIVYTNADKRRHQNKKLTIGLEDYRTVTSEHRRPQNHPGSALTEAPLFVNLEEVRDELDYNYDTAAQAFRDSLDNWRQNAKCAALESYISKLDLPPNTCRLHSSREQHAAALTIAGVLKRKLGAPIEIIVQDPVYSTVGKAVLTDHGMKPVDGVGGKAFLDIDSRTFVFTVFPEIPIRQIVADLARPAGMFWHRYNG
ncbi:Uu.00g066390.m01.CDS01 [Anthostomella pinea]|uniref:Uu.00g066390.m01.CDS01 n=1 Tax=Anthostomella pinea TaxID=933095 RepID=A0AAI8YN60_9PEZI|nr:Uu.00g066390.m01.CDS01 [Anthostomella pinea]